MLVISCYCNNKSLLIKNNCCHYRYTAQEILHEIVGEKRGIPLGILIFCGLLKPIVNTTETS
ncbi:hypothetical protein LSH36_717g01000 [Paralvinella palmiformis]|uniref:Uncharacterized protein n=1 Tax=Paralvinella palmiformis TaxID=53620 RepID=A0AAD9J1I7_9ANNE|nr:hypothetical protein LSH36_717g01000 [Paralvinella palmiformis]